MARPGEPTEADVANDVDETAPAPEVSDIPDIEGTIDPDADMSFPGPGA